MIIVKSPREIVLMREAGRITAGVFETLLPLIKPGVTTKHLDEEAERYIRSQGPTPNFKGVGDYPASICASVNDTLIHGIPSRNIVLKEGDIISIDVGACYKGYNGDACRTFAVGKISEEAQRLIDTTKESFYEAMKVIRPGAYLSDVSATIQQYCESRGYSLPREYTGHGIGTRLHEDPSIPNYGIPGHGPRLKVGMCLAIEPMVNEGKKEVKTMPDGWTVKTVDGKLSCHYENTIVVTNEGYEILTVYKGEKI